MTALGLGIEDFDCEIKSKEELIEAISKSSILYYSSLKQIILNEIREYFHDSSIMITDETKKFFPRKGRKSQWIKFSDFLSFKTPGLRLTNLGITLIVSTVILVITVLFYGLEEILHFKLSGLNIGLLLSGILFIPIGLIGFFCIKKLPGNTIMDLIDKIIAINTTDLLTDDKRNFKERLNDEILKIKPAHNNGEHEEPL